MVFYRHGSCTYGRDDCRGGGNEPQHGTTLAFAIVSQLKRPRLELLTSLIQAMSASAAPAPMHGNACLAQAAQHSADDHTTACVVRCCHPLPGTQQLIGVQAWHDVQPTGTQPQPST
jgi:hypothetical protein